MSKKIKNQKKWDQKDQEAINELFKDGKAKISDKPGNVKMMDPLFDNFSNPVFSYHFRKTCELFTDGKYSVVFFY
jgi:hypothetical protein